MLIKPNWEIFKAKFSENPQDNFEWFCYLLFSKEYNQPYGIHRYKNQSGIETDSIEVNGEIIGWQSKFHDVPKVETLNRDLKETLRKAKRDYPNITKIVFYTNMEWTKYHKNKDTKAEKVKAHKEIEELFEKEKIELVLRMDSYFEIYCQKKRNLNISRYFFKLDTKWELTNNGFKDTLRYCYLKNFKTISLLDEKKKRVSDIFVNLAIIKERKEEKTKDKLLNRETFLSSYEEIHKPKEPIEIKELINTSKKSLIYEKAGVGKTTFCKYIAYKWAKGELYNKFEYVVYIPLRKWDSTQLKEVIRSHYYSQYKEEIDLDIKENSNKILFLFDGYDELKSDKRDGLHKAIRDNNLTNYIITTRPYGYQKSDFEVDEYFETIGFTKENVVEYVDNFFGKDSEKGKRLKNYLQSNINIRHIGYIPLMLEMICSEWEKKEFNESLTMTELYTQSIENIFFEYTEKNGTAYIQNKEEKIFNYLGKIAFEGLEQQTIILDKTIIKENLIKNQQTFFNNYVLKVGFLNDGKAEKSTSFLNSYQFPHLTFQEYFSALYVFTLSKEERSEIIQRYKFHPRFQIFFTFLGGLIRNKKFFLEQIINSEPKDLLGIYQFNLISLCVNEIKPENIEEEKRKEIFNSFFNLLTFLNNEKFPIWRKIPSFSRNLIYFYHIIDDNFKEIFIKQKENLQEQLIRDYIEMNNSDNSKIIEILIYIIKSQKNNRYKAKMAILLLMLEENVDNFIDILIELIHDKNIQKFLRIKIASFLMFRNLDEEPYRDFFIEEISKNFFGYNFSLVFMKKRNRLTSIEFRDIFQLRSINKIIDYPNEIFLFIIKNKNINNSIKRNIIKFFHHFPINPNQGSPLGTYPRINKELIDTFFEIIHIHPIKEYIVKILLLLAEYEIFFLDKPFILNKFEKLIRYDGIIKKCLARNIGKYNRRYEKSAMDYIKILEFLLKDSALYVNNRLINKLRERIFNYLISVIDNNFTSIRDKKYAEKVLDDLKNNNKIIRQLLEEEKRKVSYNTKNNIPLRYFPLKFDKDETRKKILFKLIRYGESMDLSSIKKKHQDILVQILFDFLDEKEGTSKHKFDIFNIEKDFIIKYLLSLNDSNIQDKLIKNYTKIYKCSSSPYEYFPLFMLFKAFDKGDNIWKFLIKKAVLESIPIYINENKLCTIENGEKISTKKVNEAILNEIKILFRGKDLNG